MLHRIHTKLNPFVQAETSQLHCVSKLGQFVNIIHHSVRAGKFISFTGASAVSGTACVAGVVPASSCPAGTTGATWSDLTALICQNSILLWHVFLEDLGNIFIRYGSIKYLLGSMNMLQLLQPQPQNKDPNRMPSCMWQRRHSWRGKGQTCSDTRSSLVRHQHVATGHRSEVEAK